MSILKNFTVVDLVKTRSSSVVTITGNSLKFNTHTASELHYPACIQVLVNPKENQFAIRVCKEGEANSVPFSKPENEQKYPVKITSAIIVDVIRKMGKWPAEGNWNVPGIYFADEEAIVYDVSTAYKPVSRGGWTAKKQKEAALESVNR